SGVDFVGYASGIIAFMLLSALQILLVSTHAPLNTRNKISFIAHLFFRVAAILFVFMICSQLVLLYLSPPSDTTDGDDTLINKPIVHLDVKIDKLLMKLKFQQELLTRLRSLPSYLQTVHAIEQQPELSDSPRKALLIVNRHYKKNTIRQRVGAIHQLAKRLRAVGFTVEIKRDLSLRKLYLALDRFSRHLHHGDIAFFYYSGHLNLSKGIPRMVAIDGEGKRGIPLSLLNEEIQGKSLTTSMWLIDGYPASPSKAKPSIIPWQVPPNAVAIVNVHKPFMKHDRQHADASDILHFFMQGMHQYIGLKTLAQNITSRKNVFNQWVGDNLQKNITFSSPAYLRKQHFIDDKEVIMQVGASVSQLAATECLDASRSQPLANQRHWATACLIAKQQQMQDDLDMLHQRQQAQQQLSASYYDSPSFLRGFLLSQMPFPGTVIMMLLLSGGMVLREFISMRSYSRAMHVRNENFFPDHKDTNQYFGKRLLQRIASFAGADPQITTHCPSSDIVKYASLGVLILLLSMASGWSTGYLLYSAGSEVGDASPDFWRMLTVMSIGIGWMLMIYNLQRLILSISLNDKKDSLWLRLFSAAAPLSMGALLGVFLGISLSILVLGGSVQHLFSSDQRLSFHTQNITLDAQYRAHLSYAYMMWALSKVDMEEATTPLYQTLGSDGEQRWQQAILATRNELNHKRVLLEQNFLTDHNPFVTICKALEYFPWFVLIIILLGILFFVTPIVAAIMIWSLDTPYRKLLSDQNLTAIKKQDIKLHYSAFYHGGIEYVNDHFSRPEAIFNRNISNIKVG
ncbi:MAG: DUF4407 domain-containing protein, partial [Mariprofundales bacterium]